jgi:hypothetical protein
MSESNLRRRLSLYWWCVRGFAAGSRPS